MTPHLMTPRLSLRPLADGDATFVESLITNYLVRQYLGGVTPPDEVPGKVAGYMVASPDALTWLVTDRTGPAYGMVFLHRMEDGALALSYQFHPDAWGRGLAGEACRSVIGYAQSTGLDQTLVAETQAANKRSRRLLDVLGFAEVKTYKRFGAPQVLYAVDLFKWAP